jgi:hypothetical protein
MVSRGADWVGKSGNRITALAFENNDRIEAAMFVNGIGMSPNGTEDNSPGIGPTSPNLYATPEVVADVDSSRNEKSAAGAPQLQQERR